MCVFFSLPILAVAIGMFSHLASQLSELVFWRVPEIAAYINKLSPKSVVATFSKERG